PYGGNRAGDNLYANCLLALDARTGERKWHFQTIHHDLWDYDLPSPPVLLTIRRDGKEIPAVAQTTKTGNTFVFHRLTGEPLFPIEEVPVPPSDLAGEQASPTQPLPQAPPPFTRQGFTRKLITTRTPEAQAAISAAYDTLRGGQMFVPPSLQGTLVFPGFDGGAEWGGPAVDPHRGILYVNANEMVWTVTMMEHDRYQQRLASDRSPGRMLYDQHCLACHGPDLKGDGHYGYPALIGLNATYTPDSLDGLIRYGVGMMPGFPFLNADEARQIRDFLLGLEDRSRVADTTITQARRMALPYVSRGFYRLLDPDGYPAIQPPWGTLSAIDLNSGEMLWQTPLGEFPELSAQGIPRTGTENYGGPILTAGKLIFIGATKDEQFRAFDQESGAELWRYALPAGGYATPATYAVDGRQFVVIACGGDKMGTKSGDSFVAFVLPVE
ncbi:MAG: pyrroloquinoline quinone-dependent dehydrogenase, partial [Bacteroidetes bacterium]